MSLTALKFPANEIRVLGEHREEYGVPGWEQIAHRRRDEIYRAIPPSFLVPPDLLGGTNLVNLFQTCGILTPREICILQMSATKLLESIHRRAYSSVEVATAFCKSAAIAHQAVRTFSRPSPFQLLTQICRQTA
jgi:amidase